MPASNLSMIRKLTLAINTNGGRVLMDRVQFFSEQEGRPITLYKVCEVVPKGEGTKKNVLFETASQLQVVLFLRDYWFVMQGKELPAKNNMEWVEIRKKKKFDFSEAERLHEEIMRRREHVGV